MADSPDSADLAGRRLWPLPPGTVLFRNHARSFAGDRFNPCQGPPSRFAPLYGPDGDCIPSLYLATDFDGAAFETVFRGPVGRFSTIPRQGLDDRAVSRLRIASAAPLGLIPLFTPEPIALDLRPEAVFAASPKTHAQCRDLAAALHRTNPAAQGLVWSAVRDSASTAILLFGDRVGSNTFVLEDTRTVDSDPSLLSDFIATAARAGYRIAR